MKVAVIQVDGKIPNLALMKLAAHHQNHDDQVVLGVDASVDRAYISVIWPQNRPTALGIAKLFPDAEVVIGGTGFNYSVTLPDEIEHTMPAYDLWNIDYSMGFTTRGCIRNCGFCIVPAKEGWIHSHSPLSEFIHPDHEKVILMDNNLLGAPNRFEVLDELHDRGLMVNFNQGLDIRLVDYDIASRLARLRFRTSTFSSKYIHFAFDDPSLEPKIREGVATLIEAGFKPDNLTFYVLVGYNTTFEEDMHRYRVLWDELGCWPFIMNYNNGPDPLLRAFSRWVNRRLHKTIPWEEYRRNPERLAIA